jgi:hypothetical protein
MTNQTIDNKNQFAQYKWSDLASQLAQRKEQESADFTRLLEKPVELAEDPETANWNPTIQHDEPAQIKRYFELMANFQKLTAEEQEEFTELMNIIVVDGVPKLDEGWVIRFSAPYTKIITALTKEKAIKRALCHLGNIPTGVKGSVDGSKTLTKNELRRYIQNL